jgi:hypothetical protein
MQTRLLKALALAGAALLSACGGGGGDMGSAGSAGSTGSTGGTASGTGFGTLQVSLTDAP